MNIKLNMFNIKHDYLLSDFWLFLIGSFRKKNVQNYDDLKAKNYKMVI